MRYRKSINTVHLLGEQRVRTTSVGMLLLAIVMLFFLSLLIHLDEEDNIILYALTYSTYILIFIGNLYLLFNTAFKLFIAPLWMGLSFLVLGVTPFVICATLFWESQFMNAFLSTVGYIAVLAVIGCIFKVIRFYSFKSRNKVGSSVLTGTFCVGIGRTVYAFIKEQYGETVVNAMMPSLLFLLSVIFGIAGILYMNQYFLIKSGRFRNIRWND